MSEQVRRIVLTDEQKKEYEQRINLKHQERSARRKSTKSRPQRCPSCNRLFYYWVSLENCHPGYCRKRCQSRGPNATIRAKEKTLSWSEKLENRKKRKEERRKAKAQTKLTKAQYRSKAIEFYKSDAWQKLRFEAFRRYGRRCLLCGQMPPNVILHVDHVKPRMTHPELELDIENLQILCEDCNKGKGATTADFRDHGPDFLTDAMRDAKK